MSSATPCTSQSRHFRDALVDFISGCKYFCDGYERFTTSRVKPRTDAQRNRERHPLF